MAAAESSELVAIARDLREERDRRRRLEMVVLDLAARAGIEVDLGPEMVGVHYVDSLLRDRDREPGAPLVAELPPYVDPTGFDAVMSMPENDPRRIAALKEREKVAAAILAVDTDPLRDGSFHWPGGRKRSKS